MNGPPNSMIDGATKITGTNSTFEGVLPAPMMQGQPSRANPCVDVTVLGLVGGAPAGASVIDTLANLKIRLDSVKRITQIQNTSYSFAETKYFSVAAREHTLAPPGRHRPRHSRMRLTGRQSRPAINAAIYYPNSTLYQLQPSFHT